MKERLTLNARLVYIGQISEQNKQKK
jgi:hypothetical protein